MFCATVLYPSREGRSFDFERYAHELATLYAQFLPHDTRQDVLSFHLHRQLLGQVTGAVYWPLSTTRGSRRSWRSLPRFLTSNRSDNLTTLLSRPL